MFFCLAEVCLWLKVVPPWQGGRWRPESREVFWRCLYGGGGPPCPLWPWPARRLVRPGLGLSLSVCLSGCLVLLPGPALHPFPAPRGGAGRGRAPVLVSARGCLSVSGHVLCGVCTACGVSGGGSAGGCAHCGGGGSLCYPCWSSPEAGGRGRLRCCCSNPHFITHSPSLSV